MDRIQTYGLWDCSVVNIPERTRLFSLQPLAVGTSQVESLGSYIIRLAEAHVVTVGDLAGREIARQNGCKDSKGSPRSRVRYRRGGHGFHALSYEINGIHWQARKWTARINRATGRSDLELLTLLPFAKVLSAMLLLKPRRAWCPFCYEEDRQKGPIYERLAWTINAVTVCSRHCVPLLSRCQHCNRPQPALAVYSHPGRCSHCGYWLGASDLKTALGDIGQGCGDYAIRSIYCSFCGRAGGGGRDRGPIIPCQIPDESADMRDSPILAEKRVCSVN